MNISEVSFFEWIIGGGAVFCFGGMIYVAHYHRNHGLIEALDQIAKGAANPQEIARKALKGWTDEEEPKQL